MATKQQRRRPPEIGQSNARAKKKQAAPKKEAAPKKRKSTADVVYTPAPQFSRNRLLLRLATVVAVVLALVFGVSIFFKVENVVVTGANKYSAYAVKEASGIKIGENLLSFGKTEAYGRIIANLPYVESVHIGIKLPDTVNIVIKELDVVYSVQDSADAWWRMTSDGRIIERAVNAGDCTKVLGVKLESPMVGQTAVAYERPADPTGEATQPVTVRGSDKLSAALSILQYLEDCSIIGEAASVDVEDLELWYGKQYQVKLGDTSQLKYKIQCMNEAINGESGLQEYDSGVLDISFTLKKDQIVYDPLDSE